MPFDLTRSVASAGPFSLRVSWKIARAGTPAFLYISGISLVQSLYRIIHKASASMKIEIEFKDRNQAMRHSYRRSVLCRYKDMYSQLPNR
jgi:hypothetical protein